MEEKKPKNRIKMREQEPLVRARNFMEVPYGYTPEEAIEEASRCLNCSKPACRTGCPVSVDIPSFIKLVKEGRFIEAAWKIKEENAMPAVCGRVCPQEIQCESMCILGKKGEPVAIGNLERFVADYERDKGEIQVPERPKPSGRKVAIIGSGPGGLSCSADLIKSGHRVTLFEALHKPGGVLIYGIPGIQASQGDCREGSRLHKEARGRGQDECGHRESLYD